MIYKAYSDEIAKLRSLPETGMGYQVIDAKLYRDSWNTRRFVVYNSQLLVPIGDVPTTKTKLFSEGFTRVFNSADTLGLDTSSIALVTKRQIIEQRSVSFSHIVNAKRKGDTSKGARDNPKVPCNGGEVFVRLSAYEDDLRIDTVNRRLTEGSYTTTHTDYCDCVDTNDDPVDRYALPNDEVIKWAFFILPKNGDQVQMGIVQPANGHEGGGIEAYFENGTSNNTYLYRRDYGQKN